jgi:hypothetical protein
MTRRGASSRSTIPSARKCSPYGYGVPNGIHVEPHTDPAHRSTPAAVESARERIIRLIREVAELLTIAEVAAILGLSRRHVCRLHRADRLPFLGRRARYHARTAVQSRRPDPIR